MEIQNVVLPNHPPRSAFDLTLTSSNTIQSITPRQQSSPTSSPLPSLLLPSLCHPHVHLDKAFLLTTNQVHCNRHHSPSANHKDGLPDYSDLVPSEGSFQEALGNTSQAKERYTHTDLILRGSQLIIESIRAGVTSMRAFVEIDHVTQFKCLDAGIELKKKFQSRCHVQITAFAQDPIFSTDHGEDNRRLMEEALNRYGGEIDVIGTTPYVEQQNDDSEKKEDASEQAEHPQSKNIKWAISTCLKHNKHLDFHLDYNLDESTPARLWDVIEQLTISKWPKTSSRKKTIVVGHCTRLTTFSQAELQWVARLIHANKLPISFVGLPTSDLYMMGRPAASSSQLASKPGSRPRGTIPILSLIKDYGLGACIGINNVGNAFTPWGSVDPLSIASLGVGLYHAGTEEDAKILYDCVSDGARRAIGLDLEMTEPEPEPHLATDTAAAETVANPEKETEERVGNKDRMLEIKPGSTGPFLLVQNEADLRLEPSRSVSLSLRHGEAEDEAITVPSRQRLAVKDVIWDPPEWRLRSIIY